MAVERRTTAVSAEEWNAWIDSILFNYKLSLLIKVVLDD